MKFDYTNGQKAKYMVSVYGWNVEDRYYVTDMNTAKRIFNALVESARAVKEDRIITINDLIKDVRKAYTRI